MSEVRTRARTLVDSPALTYKQRVQALAGLAEETLDPPPTSAAVTDALATGLVCDIGEGHAPYRPRYLLPDYPKALRQGSEFLGLEPPADLYEAVAFLLSMYSQVPSITGYPVYLGDVDSLLEPYAKGVDDETLTKILRLMWVTIDRSLPDAFTHANLGPDDSRVGRTILALERELLQTVPNLTLKVDAERTPDSLVLDAVRTVFACGKPHFVNHAMMTADLGPDYGVVSCYNSLRQGGGSHTLVRLNLAESARRNDGGVDDYLATTLPEHVAVTAELMAARITSLVEQAQFFDHSWLADEGLVHLDRMSAMFGVYGLAECVDSLVAAGGGTGRYGHDADATALAVAHRRAGRRARRRDTAPLLRGQRRARVPALAVGHRLRPRRHRRHAHPHRRRAPAVRAPRRRHPEPQVVRLGRQRHPVVRRHGRAQPAGLRRRRTGRAGHRYARRDVQPRQQRLHPDHRLPRAQERPRQARGHRRRTSRQRCARSRVGGELALRQACAEAGDQP